MKKEITFDEFLQYMWGVPPKKESEEPKVADDIIVTRCEGCPFQREMQNTCWTSCYLTDSVILDYTNIMTNCPLRVKSVNVSIDWDKKGE